MATLFERDQQSLLGVYAKAEVEFVNGQGSWLVDAAGRRYLDFGSGIAVNALGHAHPAVLAAIQKQAAEFIHISNLYLNTPQIELAEALLSELPFDKVFFCNSGTEANEALLKFARKVWSHRGQPERVEVLSFVGSFHGRTLGALSVTAQKKFQEGFGPMPGGVTWLPFNDVEALRAAVNERTAAILLEPIQAEGGINTPTPEFIEVLHALRQETGVLILGDEIQCAMGRLGPMLGSLAVGLEPDMVSLAKPIGAGLPLGAVLLRSAEAEALKPGDHGTTFGGNPVACAAGLAVWDTLHRPGSAAERSRVAEVLEEGLQKLARKYPQHILEIRGKGFLRGLQTPLDLAEFITRARKSEGLIVLRAGSDVLRLLPPVNVSEAEVKLALKGLDQVFGSF
jgi:acetylornithine/N-succinyldiaminopimelate aminotransferase